MNFPFSKRDAVTYLILGVVFLLIAGLIVAVLHTFALPQLATYFEENLNMAVMIGITVLIPAFISKAFYTYACMKLRVFVLNVRYSVVDGLTPILSDFRLKNLYLSMVTDVYLEDNNGNPYPDVRGLKRFFIKNLGNINLFLTLLFFADLIGVSAYLIVTRLIYIFDIRQIMWLVSLLLIYNCTIFVRSMMLAVTYMSMGDWIVSRNPIYFMILPIIIPIISAGYLLLVVIGGFVLGMNIQQPFFNILSLFGVPIFNPIISAIHAKFAVDDSKRTIDEMRRQNGMAPQVW